MHVHESTCNNQFNLSTFAEDSSHCRPQRCRCPSPRVRLPQICRGSVSSVPYLFTVDNDGDINSGVMSFTGAVESRKLPRPVPNAKMEGHAGSGHAMQLPMNSVADVFLQTEHGASMQQQLYNIG